MLYSLLLVHLKMSIKEDLKKKNHQWLFHHPWDKPKPPATDRQTRQPPPFQMAGGSPPHELPPCSHAAFLLLWNINTSPAEVFYNCWPLHLEHVFSSMPHLKKSCSFNFYSDLCLSRPRSAWPILPETAPHTVLRPLVLLYFPSQFSPYQQVPICRPFPLSEQSCTTTQGLVQQCVQEHHSTCSVCPWINVRSVQGHRWHQTARQTVLGLRIP